MSSEEVEDEDLTQLRQNLMESMRSKRGTGERQRPRDNQEVFDTDMDDLVSLRKAALHTIKPSTSSESVTDCSLTGMNSAAAPSPTFPSCLPTPFPPEPGEILTGMGKLIWLGSQVGFIGSDVGVISFQLKEFCDQAVNDLTLVLCPGFILKFQALAAPGLNYSVDGQEAQWVATFAAPVHGPEAKQLANGGVNLEAKFSHLTKEPYSIELESKAIPLLLSIFKRNGLPQCQLGNFLCHISNCGDVELSRYVGMSSFKRRQSLERRTHLFDINSHDLVVLKPAANYITVVTLTKQLLIRGGACLMQELFDHFGSCPDIPMEARDMIGEGKNHFLSFLQAHPWIFTVFPSQVFVSVRRNLPHFDYGASISENFPDYKLHNFSPTNGLVSVPPAPSHALPPSTPDASLLCLAVAAVEQTNVTIFGLPNEILKMICSYITSIKEKMKLEQVSQRFNHVSSHRTSWKGTHSLQLMMACDSDAMDDGEGQR